jgi:hypothetical protein
METLPGIEEQPICVLTGWEGLESFAQEEESPLISGLQNELPGLEEAA